MKFLLAITNNLQPNVMTSGLIKHFQYVINFSSFLVLKGQSKSQLPVIDIEYNVISLEPYQRRIWEVKISHYQYIGQ